MIPHYSGQWKEHQQHKVGEGRSLPSKTHPGEDSSEVGRWLWGEGWGQKQGKSALEIYKGQGKRSEMRDKESPIIRGGAHM
jgi:hypothetical protein